MAISFLLWGAVRAQTCTNNLTQADIASSCAGTTCTLTSPTFPNQTCLSLSAPYSLLLTGILSSPNSYSFSAPSITLSSLQGMQTDPYVSLWANASELTLIRTVLDGYEGLFLAGSVLQSEDSSLSAGVIALSGSRAVLQNSSLTGTAIRCFTGCNCQAASTCDDSQVIAPDFSLSNCTLSLLFNQSLNLNSSLLTASALDLATGALAVTNSKLSADALSCFGSYGLGCGVYSPVLGYTYSCGSTGASHGGRGGSATGLSSSNQCLLIEGRGPYFGLAGSAGGGKNSGSGGGFISVSTTSILSSAANFSADGGDGKYSSGGGSGGTLLFKFKSWAGQALLTARGGAGGSLSGSGGGGIIYFFKTDWSDPNAWKSLPNLQVDVAAGEAAQLNKGQAGMLQSNPCPSGFQLQQLACVPCPVGTYQLFPSQLPCRSCQNKPRRSKYVSDSPCAFQCEAGTSYAAGECLNPFQTFYATAGGQVACSVVATVGLFLLLVASRALYSGVASIRSDFRQRKLKQQESSSALLDEQLPMHKYRLVLGGSNSPQDPWVIERRSFEGVKDLFLESAQFESFVAAANRACGYSVLLRYYLKALGALYLPFYYSTLEGLRLDRALALVEAAKELYPKIKFSYSSRLTVGAIQIFNRDKSVLDFTIECLFPLLFLAESTIFGALRLQQDCFMRRLLKDRRELLALGLEPLLKDHLPALSLRQTPGNFEMAVCVLLSGLQVFHSNQSAVQVRLSLELDGRFYALTSLEDYQGWYRLRRGRLLVSLFLGAEECNKRFLYRGFQERGKEIWGQDDRLPQVRVQERGLWQRAKVWLSPVTLGVMASKKSSLSHCTLFALLAGSILVVLALHLLTIYLYAANCPFFLLPEFLLLPLDEELCAYYWLRSVIAGSESYAELASLSCYCGLIKSVLLFLVFFGACQQFLPMVWLSQALLCVAEVLLLQVGRRVHFQTRD